MSTRLRLGALASVVAVVLAALGLWWWRSDSGTALQQAVSRAPADTERMSWTDWAGVRRTLHSDVSADSDAGALRRFLTQGYDADLTSASALVQSAPVLQQRFGISPASVDWELFSQSGQGAVVMLHVPDSFDLGALGDRLEGLGYVRPTEDTGVWRGGPDLLTRISSDLTPELAHIALDEADHLVLTSDRADYLAQAVEDATGSGATAAGLDDVVAAAGEPLSAAIYTGDYACGALAMGQADPADRRAGDQLLAAAGQVNPYTAMAMSVQPDRHVRISFSFENGDQARTNADTRARLARGPAPGQGGDFTDRFTLDRTTAKGSVVTMDVTPARGAYVLSDLSTGPLLFATC